MDIGDLERTFASAIYSNRVPLAVIAFSGLALLAALAWRGRSHHAALRRPRLTVGGLVIVVAVLGPVGWYLASPLVLSRSIDEPLPSVAPATPAASPAGTSVAERSGSFTGADEFHFGRGVVRLIETAPGTQVVRLEDFAVRNGPDLYLYLSPSADGYVPEAVELGRLKADRGNQNYAVPAGTDVSNGRSVVVWCRQFSVLFAVARLS